MRFDDIVRTERYFTATLLPVLLLHDNFGGLREFITLVSGKAETEHNRFGRKVRRVAGAEPFSLNSIELITEFHIARDLQFAHFLELDGYPLLPGSRTETPHLDAPDLVIVGDSQMIVCEGKFFGQCLLTSLNRQLHSQRRQIERLLKVRPLLTRYLHIALLPPIPSSKLNPKDVHCDAAVTWKDVGELSNKVLGADHYVSRRFQSALWLYQRTIRDGNPTVPNFDGKLQLHEALARCGAQGDQIQIGHEKGELGLRRMSPDRLRKKQWKWRDPATNQGVIDRRSWIPGKQFLDIVDLMLAKGRLGGKG